MKRALSTTLSLCLGVMASTAIAETKNPGTFVFLWTDDIQSFDPAYIADPQLLRGFERLQPLAGLQRLGDFRASAVVRSAVAGKRVDCRA